MRTEDFIYMRWALLLAEEAFRAEEVPVGALVLFGDEVLGSGRNRVEERSLPTAHAELIALEEACRRMCNHRLTGATLYTTLEPCVMCWGAILHARISRVVIGARDLKAGALSFYRLPATPPSVEFGVLEEESAALLRHFFEERR